MKDRGGQVVYHAECYGPEEAARFSWDGEPVTLQPKSNLIRFNLFGCCLKNAGVGTQEESGDTTQQAIVGVQINDKGALDQGGGSMDRSEQTYL